MNQTHKRYTCERCGREITQEEYETYDGMCQDCYEIEIDELDYEDDY
jgi:NMD protein affecting ribosome stability and mRNA decay